uniref:Uncharacterized protein n=1 Tax=Setaria viridis TaxID=4556 RepID=A0A4U6UIX1_SETVI|nr:hypothetical protein SEVIR_5G182500v2 [Setaria viridis]TKW14684.1 hypothetical protein SEVIR_5G182500v2 [Setaria viridis]
MESLQVFRTMQACQKNCCYSRSSLFFSLFHPAYQEMMMIYGANHKGNCEACTLLPCFSVFYIIFYSFPRKET